MKSKIKTYIIVGLLVVLIVISYFAFFTNNIENTSNYQKLEQEVIQGVIKTEIDLDGSYTCPLNIPDAYKYDKVWCEVRAVGTCGLDRRRDGPLKYICAGNLASDCDLYISDQLPGVRFSSYYCFGSCQFKNYDWVNPPPTTRYCYGCLGYMPEYDCEWPGTVTKAGQVSTILDYPKYKSDYNNDGKLDPIQGNWYGTYVPSWQPLPGVTMQYKYTLNPGDSINFQGSDIKLYVDLVGILGCKGKAYGTPCSLDAKKCINNTLYTCVDTNLDSCGDTWAYTGKCEKCITPVPCSDSYCENGVAYCGSCPVVNSCSKSQFNSYRCSGTTREQCKLIDDCYVWTSEGVTQCTATQKCSAGTCITDCSSVPGSCTIGFKKCISSTSYQNCIEGSGGCGYWGQTTNCGLAEECSTGIGVSVPGTVDMCNINCTKLLPNSYCTPGDTPICVNNDEWKCTVSNVNSECYEYSFSKTCTSGICINGQGCATPYKITIDLGGRTSFTKNEDIIIKYSISEGAQDPNAVYYVSLINKDTGIIDKKTFMGLPRINMEYNFGKRELGNYAVEVGYIYQGKTLNKTEPIVVTDSFSVRMYVQNSVGVYAGKPFNLIIEAFNLNNRVDAVSLIKSLKIGNLNLPIPQGISLLTGQYKFEITPPITGTLEVIAETIKGDIKLTTTKNILVTKPKIIIDEREIDKELINEETGRPQAISNKQYHLCFETTAVGEPIETTNIIKYRGEEITTITSPSKGRYCFTITFPRGGVLSIFSQNLPDYETSDESIWQVDVDVPVECGNGRCEIGEDDSSYPVCDVFGTPPCYCVTDCGGEQTSYIWWVIGAIILITIITTAIIVIRGRKK